MLFGPECDDCSPQGLGWLTGQLGCECCHAQRAGSSELNSGAHYDNATGILGGWWWVTWQPKSMSTESLLSSNVSDVLCGGRESGKVPSGKELI